MTVGLDWFWEMWNRVQIVRTADSCGGDDPCIYQHGILNFIICLYAALQDCGQAELLLIILSPNSVFLTCLRAEIKSDKARKEMLPHQDHYMQQWEFPFARL